MIDMPMARAAWTLLSSSARRVVQPWVSRQARRGMAFVDAWSASTGSAVGDAVLDKAADVLSLFVSIEFYVSMLPIVCWFHGHAKFLELIVMTAATYWMGQAVKDIAASPRPSDMESERAASAPASAPASASASASASARRRRKASSPAPALEEEGERQLLRGRREHADSKPIFC